jgi:hypothetical protein
MRENFKSRSGCREIYVFAREDRGRESYHVADYEKPEENFLSVDTTGVTPEECISKIVNHFNLV